MLYFPNHINICLENLEENWEQRLTKTRFPVSEVKKKKKYLKYIIYIFSDAIWMPLWLHIVMCL